ncbi:MAG: hypothetical protein K1X89_27360, partial [Myxococcaceae bacterium]|nr:hypothetical protein [Myxococcaceae bacterium]
MALVGHRAAGKSSLLPHLKALTGRQAFDLDDVIAQRSGRNLRDWVRSDEPSFRVAERETFLSLPRGVLVAVGGGFLSHHGSLLLDAVAALVPISFETYRERLLQDTTRPRLRPRLTLEDELHTLYEERTHTHARVGTRSVAEVFARAAVPPRAARVVTLPPGQELRHAARM